MPSPPVKQRNGQITEYNVPGETSATQSESPTQCEDERQHLGGASLS